MPDGYLVQLGDNSLDEGDGIVGSLITFTTDQVLGDGNWEWSGTWSGSTFTNESEPGEYILASDGNVYFVPDFGPVDTLTGASVTGIPSFVGTTGSDSSLTGTFLDDDIDGLEGDDTIQGLGGADEIAGGGGNDDIEGNGGADTINAGDGDDTAEGGSGADVVSGGAGSDDVYGNGGADVLVGGSGSDDLYGGTGNDTLYGGQDPAASTSESFQWSEFGGNGANVGSGFTQTTGQMDVTVTLTNDGALTGASVDTATTQYTETDDAFSDSSALVLTGNGGADTVTVDFNFTSNDDGDTADAVENVSFRINDIDSLTWIDTLEINAFDANGNPVTVTITAESASNTVDGNEVTAGVGNGGAGDATGSILVQIAGPVSDIEIIYGNDGSANQAAWITDLTFDTIPLDDGADLLVGGEGEDEMYGGAGADTFQLADGDDAYGEEGDDLFILNDLGETSADIFIDGGEDGETGGDTLQLNGLASLSDVTFDSGSTESGTITLTNGTIVTFTNIENIICFTPGTEIATPFGPRRIEDLRRGDLVLTRDNGPQPIRWIGARTVPAAGDFAPVELLPSALEGATAPLLVSPQHRMLFSGYRAELLFGESEVLVAAKHLVDGHAVRFAPRATVTYMHMMFDRHEVVLANGAATESFFAGDEGLGALTDASREELFAIFPELRSSHGAPTARRALKAYEAALL
ncbi:MAG: Hint domain-containing protein [Pseudomonadota bacterium]